ncbi:MAG: asparagine synthase (glutamine-hydrolyzing) [Gammaproteobacteria bacterium]|nr:asparagine synthase (glutamine-hydrolyzing) [Gammaproteobacteria bacterium]
MCGIAGLLLSEGHAERPQLEAMAAILGHRGPDNSGVHLDGPLGLAHTRLSIIDVAGGHQPLFTKQGKIVLVANGEIYNHIELRKELEQRGHRFSTHSDCETILHAYVEYGSSFLKHLYGMFAFALFDTDNKRLILARDRLGIKPLYLAQLKEGIAFASELKALLVLPSLSREIRPTGMLEYLQNQFVTGRDTILNAVEQVLPGEVLIMEQGQALRRNRYWSSQDITHQDIGYDLAKEQFDDLMDTVIRQHIRADVPYGLFLSGGVDSSLLLALLSRHNDEPIRSFSVGFPGTAIIDELPTAQILAQHFATEHSLLEPDPQQLCRRLPHTVWAADSLMQDYANLPTSMLAERAGQELKVVFTGEGGDETFAGYGRYRMHPILKMMRNLASPGSGGFRIRGALRQAWPQLYSTALGDEMQAWRKPFIKAWQATPDTWTDLQRMQYIDLTTALPDNLLVKVDRMLMAWGVEGRVPLLDHRVVEFGLGLPDKLKIHKNQGKTFLKRYTSELLPGVDFWKKKRGFTVPVKDWLSKPFLNRLDQVLPHSPALTPWFQAAGIQQLIQQQRNGVNVSRPILSLLHYAIWHRLFIEGSLEAPDPDQDPIELIS